MKSPALLALLLVPALLRAQLPSELLLIVNGSSPDALTVANHYSALREIPAERVLVLNPPTAFFRAEEGGTRWQTTAEAVREHLLIPVLAKLEALQDPFPTALVFSPDWPTHLRLADGTPASVTAFVGNRGEMPEPELVKNGQARSPWFTAPDERAQGRRLHRFPAPELAEAGMHPAMMLGVFYEPLDTAGIVQALERAAGADFTRPSGSVAIITNTDVRTRARLFQFEPAAARLRERDVPTHLAAREEAPLPEQLIGVMEGAASVPTGNYHGRLLPGSFAEHLTSFAGTLHNPHQTKMTRWIAAGAAGTVGTVDEPFAIWSKFPLAEIFERYLLGNTLLEALMQSIRCPYQSLAIGDPLCRPWAAPLPELSLRAEWEGNRLRVRAEGVRGGPGTDLHLFVDGRRVPGSGPEWEIPLTAETAGPRVDLLLHARRLWAPPEVGSARIRVESPFAEQIRLSAPREQGRETLRLKLESRETLMAVELRQGDRVLWRGDAEGTRHRFEISRDQTGGGPLRLRAFALLANGRMAWSDEWVLE